MDAVLMCPLQDRERTSADTNCSGPVKKVMRLESARIAYFYSRDSPVKSSICSCFGLRSCLMINLTIHLRERMKISPLLRHRRFKETAVAKRLGRRGKKPTPVAPSHLTACTASSFTERGPGCRVGNLWYSRFNLCEITIRYSESELKVKPAGPIRFIQNTSALSATQNPLLRQLTVQERRRTTSELRKRYANSRSQRC